MVNRLLTINLRRYMVSHPRRNRHRKTFSYLRDRIAHYSKVPIENVTISNELNELVTKHNVKSMSPVKVNVTIENGKASAAPFKEASISSSKKPENAAQKAAEAAKEQVEQKGAKSQPKPKAKPIQNAPSDSEAAPIKPKIAAKPKAENKTSETK